MQEGAQAVCCGPQVTPAGAVYSEAGMNEVAAQHGGVFVDPFTGEWRLH